MNRTGTTIIGLASLILAAACGGGGEDGVETPHAPVAAEGFGAASAPELDPIQVQEGRDIAVSMCGGCHAVDDADQSPRPDAPPLKTLLAGYDPEALTDDLVNGVKMGHQDMPEFDFSVIATDALVTYLISVSETGGVVEE